ncbi:hypothetical protein TWF694_006389 [Orbilia ellipsospora]|uniref:F-box domain-containing protein n=1 Tax=Orbilia ellipsospora TaxID=2528407 RepID=A0AAV9XRN8_9PEZI
MFPFASLPVELIQLVSKGLSAGDLLNLRLASKATNYKTRDAHLNALYARRTYFLSSKSLRILLKISKDPELRFRVNYLQLDIACAIFNLADSVNLNNYKDEDEDEQGNSIDWLAQSLLGNNSTFSEGGSCFVSDVPLDGQHAHLLAATFTGLPNLKTVEVINGYDLGKGPSLRTFQLYNPFNENGDSDLDITEYERACAKEWANVYTLNAHHVVPAIFAAMAKSQLELESIQLDDGIWKGRVLNSTSDSLAVWLPELLAMHKKHKSKQSKLRHLELPLGSLSDGDSEAFNTIFEYLLLFSDTLESLKLVQEPSGVSDLSQHPSSPPHPPSSQLPAPYYNINCPVFPNLVSLQLENLTTSSETLHDLLISFKDTLQTLHLVSCTIQDPPLNWRKILESYQE